jgi:conjugal transfer pilin signal peptidase TrbI
MSDVVAAPQQIRPRFAVQAALLTVCMVAGWAWLAERYRLGIDPQISRCLPDTRVVLIDQDAALPARGGLVAFRAENLTPLFPDGTILVKILAGVPGDRIAVTEEVVAVNHRTVARGLAVAGRLGHLPADFVRTVTVPPDHYFVIGRSEDSFDSRYYGFVAGVHIIGPAWRLF